MKEIRRLRPPGSNWREIAEHEAARVELQAQVELARLMEERKHLEVEHGRVDAALKETGTSEARLRAHAVSKQWWTGLLFLAVGIAGASAWWSVGWYMTLGWEKVLVAVTVVVLPLIGWVALLGHLDIPEVKLRRMMVILGLVIVFGSIVAGASLAIGRMAGTSLVEEQQSGSGQSSDLDRSAERGGSVARAERVKRILAITSIVAVLFLGLAGEAAAGIAFDEFMRHSTVVRTVKPLYKKREEAEKRLIENAHLQELARRRGRLTLITHQLTGLRSEEAEARMAINAARLREDEERRAQSFGPLLWKVAIAFTIALGAAVIFASWALGAELTGTTVVLLDLSASTVAGEFQKNVYAVEGVIRHVGTGGRLTVFGITDSSFGTAPLLQIVAPTTKGRFGERLGAWQDTAIRDWRKLSASLSPTARGTDIFGALARAAVECEGAKGSCHVLVLSDMRQVGRGINLERAGLIPTRLVAEAVHQGLVPRMRGARVWALGVHTAGIDERQWQGLRAFWTEYFRLAQAELVAFTPNRRLAEGG